MRVFQNVGSGVIFGEKWKDEKGREGVCASGNDKPNVVFVNISVSVKIPLFANTVKVNNF